MRACLHGKDGHNKWIVVNEDEMIVHVPGPHACMIFFRYMGECNNGRHTLRHYTEI